MIMGFGKSKVAEVEVIPSVIKETQHYISATTTIGGVPETTYNKLLQKIATIYPGKIFEIKYITTERHQSPGSGWTISALIEEIDA